MARNESIISVFVASPSDVSEERKAIESVIFELNHTWSKSLSLRLELIKWETNVYPNFANYPQEVINKQLNDEYDVFIALFWSKVGSPTKVAESGTIEEFERAYNKYKKDSSSVDLLVYFKDQAIPPSKMDFEQLQKIQNLKNQLGEKGGLYWTFDNAEDFETLLRGHLSRVAQKWATKLVSSPPIKQPSDQSADEIAIQFDDEDDYGFFDYSEIYESRITDMTSALESIAEATQKIGAQFAKRTTEIQHFTADKSNQIDNKSAKKLIAMASDDMDRFSDTIDYQVEAYSTSSSEAFDALSKAISISIEMTSGNSNTELEDSLCLMITNATSTEGSLSGFEESLINLPRLTIQMNKSKRRAAKSLRRVLDEIRRTKQAAADVLKTIKGLTQ